MNQEKDIAKVFLSYVSVTGEFVHVGQFMAVLDEPAAVAQLADQKMPPKIFKLIQQIFYEYAHRKPFPIAKDGSIKASILKASFGFVIHACCTHAFPECKVIVHKRLAENEKTGRKFSVRPACHYFELNKGAAVHSGSLLAALTVLNSYLEHANEAELKFNEEKSYLLFYGDEDAPEETPYACGFQAPLSEMSAEEKAVFAQCPVTHYPVVVGARPLGITLGLRIPKAKWHAREKLTLEDIV